MPKRLSEDQEERLERLYMMTTNGQLYALRVPNVGRTRTGVNGCWFILWVFMENGTLHVQDRTIQVAKTLGFRFNEKKTWLVSRNFNLDASDIQNEIREQCNVPEFKLKVIV